jgi:hypothetical protein
MRRSLWLSSAAAALLLTAVGVVAAYRAVVETLHDAILEALGPHSRVERIEIGWASIVIEGIAVDADDNWPAEETLRATRVTVVPSLNSLFDELPRIDLITIEQPFLSALRTGDAGFRVLPGLLTTDSTEDGGPVVTVGSIRLIGGVLELYDATVSRPPHRLRFERVDARLGDILVPTLAGRTEFQLEAVLDGPRLDGTVALQGWVDLSTRSSHIETTLRAVDLVALQPYLLQAHDARVTAGTLDMDLVSTVRANRLDAPGALTISGLELAEGKGAVATFMGMPRRAVMAFLEKGDDRIHVSFTLEGDLDDPQFSLNETLETRIASGLAGALGVSIEGIASGVETLGRGGLGAVEKVGRGVGNALDRLLGKD